MLRVLTDASNCSAIGGTLVAITSESRLLEVVAHLRTCCMAHVRGDRYVMADIGVQVGGHRLGPAEPWRLPDGSLMDVDSDWMGGAQLWVGAADDKRCVGLYLACNRIGRGDSCVPSHIFGPHSACDPTRRFKVCEAPSFPSELPPPPPSPPSLPLSALDTSSLLIINNRCCAHHHNHRVACCECNLYCLPFVASILLPIALILALPVICRRAHAWFQSTLSRRLWSLPLPLPLRKAHAGSTRRRHGAEKDEAQAPPEGGQERGASEEPAEIMLNAWPAAPRSASSLVLLRLGVALMMFGSLPTLYWDSGSSVMRWVLPYHGATKIRDYHYNFVVPIGVGFSLLSLRPSRDDAKHVAAIALVFFFVSVAVVSSNIHYIRYLATSPGRLNSCREGRRAPCTVLAYPVYFLTAVIAVCTAIGVLPILTRGRRHGRRGLLASPSDALAAWKLRRLWRVVRSVTVATSLLCVAQVVAVLLGKDSQQWDMLSGKPLSDHMDEVRYLITFMLSSLGVGLGATPQLRMRIALGSSSALSRGARRLADCLRGGGVRRGRLTAWSGEVSMERAVSLPVPRCWAPPPGTPVEWLEEPPGLAGRLSLASGGAADASTADEVGGASEPHPAAGCSASAARPQPAREGGGGRVRGTRGGREEQRSLPDHARNRSLEQRIRRDLLGAQIKEALQPVVLGRGSFGMVVAGRLDGRTQVAVKVFRSNLPSASEVAAFQAEARLMRAMPPHPHVCACHGTCLVFDRMAIVLAHMGGGSLAAALGLRRGLRGADHADMDTADKNAADIDTADIDTADAVSGPRGVLRGLAGRLALAPQLAAGLAHLHAHQCIHHDISPHNFLLSGDLRRAVLSDFGMARSTWQAQLRSTSDEHCGTLRYVAPEAVFGHSEPASDIFGLGLVLWELLACRVANDGEEPMVLLLRRFETTSSSDLVAAVPSFEALTPPDVEPGGGGAAAAAGHETSAAPGEGHQHPQLPAAAAEAPPPPAALARRARVDPALAAVIRSCWRRDPSQRPSAISLKVELEAQVEEFGGTTRETVEV